MSEDNLIGDDISEFLTRKRYIDESLRDAGWIENKDWVNEYELQGMPNASNVGYADYVLFGDDGRPLAVVEAKRTSKDPTIGRHQAKLYADLLEKKFHRRPVIFLTNGYETHILDDRNYQERKVFGIYCKRDLEKLFNLASNRSPKLSDAVINNDITNRYYQKGAIKAVCSSFENKQRKALLVMATGSGKTRTIISIVDVLLRKGWIKNVLFLADRTSLVKQAKKAFVNLLPNFAVANVCETNADVHARGIFSTYQTMINLIDTTREKDKSRTFSNGHFDLIIVDEAHRSIYKKYKEIFDYFDGLLVGLTATPKDEIDKNTYEIFNLPRGEPTYGYELAQAVKDGYLVDFKTVEVQTKFLQRGIEYIDLTDEEKEEYEDLFISDGEAIPEKIENSKLNEWIFNRDTIIRVLDNVMRLGLKVNDGSTIGKTIIFAKKHIHAEKILEIFNEQYPSYIGMCQVIDNRCAYADDLIEDFKKPESKVRIAISVDMLDTGIDIPELLNLVFFKPVYSKAKFWQMIGRGTRLCPGLIDGKDKEMFYIFDFCGSFEFFRVNSKGIPGNDVDTIQGRIFSVKCMMAYLLQDIKYQEEPFCSFREEIVKDLQTKILELNKDNFTVKQHLRAVEYYAKKEVLDTLNQDDVINMCNELAHLILPYPDDYQAVRFDAIMAMIEQKHLTQSPMKMLFNEVRKRAELLSKKMVIPDVANRADTIRMVLMPDYLEKCDLAEYERIRIELRSIMQYIERELRVPRETNFIDEVISIDIKNSEIEDDSLANYKEKAEFYIRNHQDEGVIKKLKTNEPLSDEDIKDLEAILWSEVGSKEDYMAEFGSKPLGVFVREITGLDMRAAKEAFSKYLDDSTLDSRQIYFVNQIVEYIAQNGVLFNFQTLTESPFTDRGSIADIFTDLTVWNGIKSIIDRINGNAETKV